jgi:hypothetical protein
MLTDALIYGGFVNTNFLAETLTDALWIRSQRLKTGCCELAGSYRTGKPEAITQKSCTGSWVYVTSPTVEHRKWEFLIFIVFIVE